MDTLLKYKGIHPGIVLEREFKKRSLKQRPFAIAINEHPQTLNERGNKTEKSEIIRFYGKQKVDDVLNSISRKPYTLSAN